MSEQPQETVVSFADGTTEGAGRVVLVVATASNGSIVVVDATPFHPLDHTWPDQPGDTGLIDDVPVVDTQMAALGPDGGLRVGSDVPVKRGEPGWTWLVAHILEGEAPSTGEEVVLSVDVGRRADLSASHTACHLAALAMNRATAGLWRPGKEVRRDSLGAPDLDQLAMVSSTMDREGSTDVYRFGKSLRKKGFEAAAFDEQLDEVVTKVRTQLAEWLRTDARVQVEDDGDRRVTGFRRWTCTLPEGTAAMPCGGTHVTRLGEIAAIDVRYEITDDGTGMTVRTTPRRAA
jgi:alanyl-tRNA synthetase